MKGIKKDLMCEVVMFSINKIILREHYSPPPSSRNCSTFYFWHIEQKMFTTLETLKKKMYVIREKKVVQTQLIRSGKMLHIFNQRYFITDYVKVTLRLCRVVIPLKALKYIYKPVLIYSKCISVFFQMHCFK